MGLPPVLPGAPRAGKDEGRRGGLNSSPPSQTGQAVLPHPAFQSVVADGLAQALGARLQEAPRQPRKLALRSPLSGRPTGPWRSAPQRLFRAPTRTALRHYVGLVKRGRPGSSHHVPTSLRSTVVTRFCATTDALTPAGPCVAAGRGSLIHVSLTSNHAVSNHLRSSVRRDPLPLRQQHYFVRASPFP